MCSTFNICMKTGTRLYFLLPILSKLSVLQFVHPQCYEGSSYASFTKTKTILDGSNWDFVKFLCTDVASFHSGLIWTSDTSKCSSTSKRPAQAAGYTLAMMTWSVHSDGLQTKFSDWVKAFAECNICITHGTNETNCVLPVWWTCEWWTVHGMQSIENGRAHSCFSCTYTTWPLVQGKYTFGCKSEIMISSGGLSHSGWYQHVSHICVLRFDYVKNVWDFWFTSHSFFASHFSPHTSPLTLLCSPGEASGLCPAECWCLLHRDG